MGRMLRKLTSLKGLSRRWKTQYSGSVFEPLESRLLLDANLLPSSDVPKAIPDQQTIVSTLAVSGQTGPVLDLEVQVDITHTWDSDLDVYLISPSGTRVELFTDVGGAGDNFTGTILDDQAGVGIASGVAPFLGSYRPEGALSALTGENPNGIWQLEITDDAGGDVGMLNGWALRITAAGTAPEIEVTGNGISIPDGDTTPSATDYTDFGTIVQASPTISRTFTVRNSGTATLTLGAVTVPAGFTLTEGLSGSLAPGASDTFTVRLDNATVGTKSGDISFSTNDGDENPFNFRITGIVAAPAAGEIDVTSNGVPIADGDITPSATDQTDFGSVPVGNTVVHTFTITNSGSGILRLTGSPTVEVVGGGGSFTVLQPVSVWIAAGTSTDFQIVYTPTAAGLHTATVRIANDDSNENPYDFVIQGTGTQEQTGWLSSPDVPKAIADMQTTVSTLTVSGLAGPITDVDVQVDITHTWDADLDVYLISPSGTRVELFTDVGGSGDNFSDTILDDQAGVGIASGVAPFSGSYRPEGFLSALTGENPNGTWRLEITDDAGGDTGTLNHWALRITAGVVQSQSVPYQQVFAAGKPGAAEGWEYYSTNDGRIEVVAGRLRMDDMLGDTTSSLNEAILHVNLTGRSNVQLVLDHVSLSDENTPLPTSFTGHYNGDGIALSVDGVHWIKVTDLTGNFTGQSFALDSVLLQAQIAAGSTNLSDVRIKFQQFDDYPSPDDGREFDNIQILAV
jgi:subtilisin-like proprotein convertase family protein